MRTAVFDTLNAGDPDELLTTGEAAALLNSSRQHVVDMCERGDLPFTMVGRHRRVRRGDLDAIRNRTQRMTRDQRRSLWLAYATAGVIVADPAHAVEVARSNIEKMRLSARGQARLWLDEWERLIDGPLDHLLDAFTSRSPRGRELRQNSPFSGVLTEQQRRRALEAWREAQGSK